MYEIKDLTLIDEDGVDYGSLEEYVKKHEIKFYKKKNKSNEELIIEIEDLNKPNIMALIFSYLKKTGEINQFNFMKLNGKYVSNDIFKIGVDSGFPKEILELINLTSMRNRIKTARGSNLECKNWTDLYKALGIKSRTTGSKFKKILLKYDLVRQHTFINSKLGKSTQLYLNPNYFRYGSHVSQQSIIVFKDMTLDKIHKYSVFNLYLNGYIEEKDLEFVHHSGHVSGT